MRKADAAHVAVMLKKLAAFHDEESLARAEHFARYAVGPNKWAYGLVASLNKHIIGFSIVHYSMDFLKGEPRAQLDLLYIDEACRGMGIGEKLVQAVIAQALRKGSKRFKVSALRKNKQANRFYVKLDLKIKEKSSLFIEYYADHLLMKNITKTPKGQTLESQK